jgi:hypothetical protein
VALLTLTLHFQDRHLPVTGFDKIMRAVAIGAGIPYVLGWIMLIRRAAWKKAWLLTIIPGLCLYVAVWFLLGGLIQIANGAFDRSDPVIHNCRVSDKFMQWKRGPVLALTGCSPDLPRHDLSVSQNCYAQASIGHDIRITTKSGLVAVPWIAGCSE